MTNSELGGLLSPEEVLAAKERADALLAGLDSAILGQQQLTRLMVTALLARGHVLLEGLPGLGKTELVKALSRLLGLEFRRLQFTPDLLPGDVTGGHILEETERGREMVFHPGPVFTNLLLADEINRASPKTQSALLEAMQERCVTVLGETRPLSVPFCVLATQNPIELEGTYPLPEAQLDRFLMKLHLEMPGEEALLTILERTTGTAQPEPDPVLDAERILAMRACVRLVPAAPETLRLAARILLATQPTHELAPESVRRFVRFGASPRGVQAMILAGKVRALVERGESRQPVLSPQDLQAVAVPCLRHRVILNFEGESEDIDADGLVNDAVAAAQASLVGR